MVRPRRRSLRVSTIETTTNADEVPASMTTEQWIAIFFVVLMVGSMVAWGAVSLT